MIVFNQIGIIHSPFKDITGMPIQPAGAVGIYGSVELFPEYTDGLKDIEGFSHIILLYHFHLSLDYSLLTKPFLDDRFHGVFATRAPKRPNQIGMSVVKLIDVKNNKLIIENVDIIDGTPLIDIKPYISVVDSIKESSIGWMQGKEHNFQNIKSDESFK